MTTRTLKIEDAARQGAALPTKERLAKTRINDIRVIEDMEGNRKLVLPDGSKLTTYFMADKINARQHDAGVNFAKWSFVAYQSPVRAQSYEGRVSGGNSEMSEAQVMARRNLQKARDWLGERLFNCVKAVCWADEPAAHWASRELGHPAGAIAMLAIALDLLADKMGTPKA